MPSVPQKNNPAGRLYAILSQAHKYEEAEQVSDTWARLLMPDQEEKAGERLEQIERDREVARLVGVMYDELELLRAELRELRIEDEGAYASVLQRTRNALSIRHLGAQWKVIRGQLTAEMLSNLRLLAAVLPVSEEPLTEEQFRQAEELVAHFHELLDDAKLPGLAVRFLRDQIGLMERALREYPIRGGVAFRTAAADAAAGWLEHLEEIGPYMSDPAVQEVRGFWREVESWGKRTLLAGSFVTMLLGATSVALKKGHTAGLLPAALEPIERVLHHDTLHGSRADGGDGDQAEDLAELLEDDDEDTDQLPAPLTPIKHT